MKTENFSRLLLTVEWIEVNQDWERHRAIINASTAVVVV